jgi:hypothetical protein
MRCFVRGFALAALSSVVALRTASAQTLSPEQVEAVQQEQYAELDRYFDAEVARAEDVRRAAWQRDTSSVAAYERSIEPWRARLAAMLGADRYEPADLEPQEELIAELPTHRAYRVRLRAFDQVHAYGVLLVPRGEPGTRFPALVCVHGMGGTPEGVCGLTDDLDYHNRFGLEAVQRGYVVFATLNMNNAQKQSWLDRKGIMVGQRMHGLEQFKHRRVVDYLAGRADVDAARVGAYGISWGGRTVMNLAALDTRVAAVAISGHFNDLVPKMLMPGEHYTAYIQTVEGYAFFWEHARLFTDADVVSLVCPRAVLIEQGRDDPVAWHEMSRKAFAEVQPYYEALGLGERAEYALFEAAHVVRGGETFDFFDRWLKASPPHDE